MSYITAYRLKIFVWVLLLLIYLYLCKIIVRYKFFLSYMVILGNYVLKSYCSFSLKHYYYYYYFSHIIFFLFVYILKYLLTQTCLKPIKWSDSRVETFQIFLLYQGLLFVPIFILELLTETHFFFLLKINVVIH